jgi:sulfur-carrier protein
MPLVTMRYWAAAKQAAGAAEENVTAASLADALAQAVARRPSDPDFQAVLARSSFLVDGEQAGGRSPDSVMLREGAVIEVLPPFAGG